MFGLPLVSGADIMDMSLAMGADMSLVRMMTADRGERC